MGTSPAVYGQGQNRTGNSCHNRGTGTTVSRDTAVRIVRKKKKVKQEKTSRVMTRSNLSQATLASDSPTLGPPLMPPCSVPAPTGRAVLLLRRAVKAWRWPLKGLGNPAASTAIDFASLPHGERVQEGREGGEEEKGKESFKVLQPFIKKNQPVIFLFHQSN